MLKNLALKESINEPDDEDEGMGIGNINELNLPSRNKYVANSRMADYDASGFEKCENHFSKEKKIVFPKKKNC